MPRHVDVMISPKKKRTRDSEISLLEGLSTSLDTYITENPSSEYPSAKHRGRKSSASDASKNAAKNFLAAKTLVKNIAKACAQERVAISCNSTGDEFDPLIDAFVDEFKERYPLLTKQLLLDGIVRYNKQNEISLERDSGDEERTNNNQQKFGPILAIVEKEMNLYYEKVESLKRSREAAAAAATDLEHRTKAEERAKKKKKLYNSENRVGKPRGEYHEPDTPKNRIAKEVLKRYVAERGTRKRLPNGVFESFVEAAKQELKLEHIQVDLDKLDKKTRFKYNRMVARGETSERTMSRDDIVIEEVYTRYKRTKEVNGGKLKAGTIKALIEGVKLEYGMPEINVANLKQKITTRFTKDHPEFAEGKPELEGKRRIGKFSEEEKKRWQLLMNEITKRYVNHKESEGKKKLPDGSLELIIEQTKKDLGIYEFEVHKTSIRGRINRKSHHVMTLGSGSPYDAIDEPLVATINAWLGQGISVSRAQGLNLANQLLRGKNLEKDERGNEMMLDAKWWRNFLERNRSKLVCQDDTPS